VNRAPVPSTNLLLVEDNPADSFVFEEALREVAPSACRLVVAETGQTALDVLFRLGKHENAPRPDLILLDLNLPGLHGHEVLRTIKEDRSLRRIPVVVLTSSRAASDVLEAYDRGANSYLQKPFTLDQAVDLVRTLRHYWLDLTLLPSAND